MEEIKTPEVLDVALITAAQKVEHYEIASYGSVCALAEALGEKEVAKAARPDPGGGEAGRPETKPDRALGRQPDRAQGRGLRGSIRPRRNGARAKASWSSAYRGFPQASPARPSEPTLSVRDHAQRITRPF